MIKIELKKFFRVPSKYLVDITEFITNSSMSKLNMKIREIKYENYDKDGDINIEKSLKDINSFYINNLEKYCSQNRLNVIRELELRKDELEQDMNYIINIIICIFTSILSSAIISFYIFWFGIMKKSFNSIIYTIISNVMGFLIIAFIILFFPMIKFIVNQFRKTKKAEAQLLDQYELKIVNEILNKKIVDMLKKK
ncbi:hypothetical protein [Clostridium thailandense]|uniref:hypothetical protein n=1 Tax=Clostridium thailandense TaxID=2794346 RepID=UPI003988AABA